MTDSKLLEAAKRMERINSNLSWLERDEITDPRFITDVRAALSVTQSQAAEIEKRVTEAHNAGFVEASKLWGIEIERYRTAFNSLKWHVNSFDWKGSSFDEIKNIVNEALSNDAGGEKNDGK